MSTTAPVKIKIPKLEAEKWHKVKVIRSKCYDGHNSVHVVFKSQIIEGVKIKSKADIYVPAGSCITQQAAGLHSDEFYVKGWKLNEYLRHLVLQGLRNKKPVVKK